MWLGRERPEVGIWKRRYTKIDWFWKWNFFAADGGKWIASFHRAALMASVDFVILPFISCLWTTLGSSAASSSESPLHEEEWPSEDQMGSTTTIVASTAPPSTPENYLNRLDFISVIVICAIVAFCFGICVIIGCRRKKRRPSQLDFTDSQPPSVTTGELVEGWRQHKI